MSTEATAIEPDYIATACKAVERFRASQGVGRPFACTPGMLKKLLASLERGNFREPACALAGIRYRTFRDWITAADNDEAGETIYRVIADAVETAEAIWEDSQVGNINAAAKDSPRFYMASLIALSRRKRERWAERTADELRQATAPTVQVLIGIAPPGTPSNQVVSVQQRQIGAGE